MQFLNSISPLSREGLAIGATIVASLVALWLCGIFSRRRFIFIKKSEETELIAYQLRRIADAMERLASEQIRPPAEVPAVPVGPEVPAEGHVSASMFGR
jgi:hypothetical protein